MKKDNKAVDYTDKYPIFTADMKSEYTILIPDMLPFHFELLEHVMTAKGYKIELLHNDGRAVIDEGLKHVHNDTCFPCLCVTGQFIDALKSGKYDVNKTALLITQSGGGCRASNYLPLIRRALRAEFPQVPVISLNFSGLEKGNGLEIDLKFLSKFAYAIYYADLIMTCFNQTKPYEIVEGESAAARAACLDEIKKVLDTKRKYKKIKENASFILNTFANVKVSGEKKVRVGIVGEIYVKYSPLGNSHLEDFLLSENCEPVVPALMDFILYCVINTINDAKFYGIGKTKAFIFGMVYKWLYGLQRKINKVVKEHGRFEPMHDFEHLRKCADKVLNQGVKMGEGWLIPAEMAALAESNVPNIVLTQPFGCLPNHVAGKGAIRTLKSIFKDENIVSIDYDPSATKVNQENRIKLMLATARENNGRINN